jgi:glycosyltransferase involved in cell wall biosynthesis
LRAVFISPTYVDAAARGKLRSLVAAGCAVTVAVPERWPDPLGRPPRIAAWEDDAGVRVVPIPVTSGDHPRLRRRALERTVSDARPDVIQVEEEPESATAAVAAEVARRLRLPLVIHSWSPVVPRLGPFARWRRQRTLQRATALLAGNGLARTILARERPGIPLAVLPQHGATPPLTVERHPASEFTMAFVGRLIPEKGLDVLLRA